MAKKKKKAAAAKRHKKAQGKKKAASRAASAKKPAAKKSKPAKPQAKIERKKAGAKAGRPQAKVKAPPAAPPPSPAPPAVGSFVWHELMTDADTDRCGDFYQGMFNWSRKETAVIPGVTYTVFRSAGKDTAGMMSMAGPDWEGQPPRWIPYVKVKDVDAASLKATQLGGRVIVPPSDIAIGRFAVIADPGGAALGVFRPEQA